MGCGDVRLLRTIGNVDFTGQERAAHNKLTMPTARIGPVARPRSFARQARNVVRPILLSRDVDYRDGNIGHAQRLLKRPAGLGDPCISLMCNRTILFYVTPFVLAHMARTRSANVRSASGLSSEYSGSVSTPTGS